ncbi:MAG: CopG family transcriptional regulator [Oscillospiraceae bacterium]|nr:CopG family transcriptional regulator [Oscillospiraceae bacterium]
MAAKKIGRPTDCPKTIDIKIRCDKPTVDKLETCSKKMQITRAEVIRRGIRKMYDDLEKK